MKLTFKDLKQQKFTVEAEPSDTILTLKEKIEKEKGWEVPLQKLIYSGKILQDQNTVESYKIEEKGFIVCMISKPKQAPAAASASPSSASTPPKKAAPSTPAQSSVPASSTPPTPAPPAPLASQNPPANPSPAPSTADTPASFNDPSVLALGAQRDAAIEQMLAMGFERADIDRAMRAAFYNPDRAVHYLLNGIPENVRSEEIQTRSAPAQAQGPRQTQPQPQPQPQPQAPSPQQPAAPAAPGDASENVNLFEAAANYSRQQANRSGGAASNPGDLEFLRNNPQFRQLCQVVRTQPNMLQPILQQVSRDNPHLAQLIEANQDSFLQLLIETAESEEDDGVPPGVHPIEVSPEEQDAIERLCRLGFERQLVIQAYFACEKDEELAANFLFQQLDEED